MDTDQIKNSFDYATLQKIGRGVAIASGAAGSIYFLQWIITVDFGVYTLAVGAIASIIINVIREYKKGELESYDTNSDDVINASRK